VCLKEVTVHYKDLFDKDKDFSKFFTNTINKEDSHIYTPRARMFGKDNSKNQHFVLKPQNVDPNESPAK
jgi:hypothetical protein